MNGGTFIVIMILLSSTSTENSKNSFSKIYDIDTSLGLFKSRGFGWRHTKEEIKFLKEIKND